MSCSQVNNVVKCENEGEIIGFDLRKCGLCWIIKVGNKVIKSSKLNMEDFGYQFDEPLKVYITIGDSLAQRKNELP